MLVKIDVQFAWTASIFSDLSGRYSLNQYIISTNSSRQELIPLLQEVRAGTTTPGAYLRSLTGKAGFSVFDWRDTPLALGDLVSALRRPRRSTHKQGATG